MNKCKGYLNIQNNNVPQLCPKRYNCERYKTSSKSDEHLLLEIKYPIGRSIYFDCEFFVEEVK